MAICLTLSSFSQKNRCIVDFLVKTAGVGYLKALRETLADELTEDLLRFELAAARGALLAAVVGVDVVGDHRIVGDDKVVLETALVGKVVGGDGQTGRDGQRLPVDARRQRRRPLLFAGGAPQQRRRPVDALARPALQLRVHSEATNGASAVTFGPCSTVDPPPHPPPCGPPLFFSERL